MTTIDELIEKRMSEILHIKEAQDIEDIDDIIELIKHHYETLPSSRIFTPDKKFSRALSFASADLSGPSGERIELAVFGYTNPRDWNEEERQKILNAWEKGQIAQEKLISKGKVMTMKTRNGREVVSEIYDMAKSDSSEWIVIDGKVLEGDEQPIPRDNQEKNTYADGRSFPNPNYGNKLGERWSMNMFALSSTGKMELPCSASIGGDMANPFSDNFLRRKAPAFGFYDATVLIDEDKSSDDELVIKTIQAITPKIIMFTDEEGNERELKFDEYIYSLLEGIELQDGFVYQPIKDFKYYLSLSEEEREEIEDSIFIVDLTDIDEFHKLIAKKNKDGTPSLTASGRNYSNWDKFGLSIPICKEVKDTKNGNQQLVLTYRGARENAFLDPTFPRIEANNCECIISFNTVKMPTRWDPELRKQIKDPENGDTNISSIFGFKKTFELQ
ncbi:MAG: hypothetical protein GF364_18235 [Candidatus Lokiarchaeota archaeon]|nr:hypothetical protein [Candidatus Lokiarchaeota archaeon]